MKNIWLTAVGCAALALAMPTAAKTDIITKTIQSNDKVWACADAREKIKQDASREREEVKKFSACQCEEVPEDKMTQGKYSCIVDGTAEPIETD